MSRNVAVAIVGSGKTTRSNVESLLADFKYAVDSITLIVPENAAEGITWAVQFAEANGITVITDKTVYAAIDEIGLLKDPSVEIKMFLLWDDDDPECQTAVSFAQHNNLSVFDLTDGLIRIPIDEVKVDAPPVTEMPLLETEVRPDEETSIPASAFLPPREDIFEAIQDDLGLEWEDDEDFAEGAELIQAALEEAGKLMAKAFVTEMLSLLKSKRDDEDEAE